jgi:hypothetical protein
MQLERLPQGVSATQQKALVLRGFPGEVDVVVLSGSLESDSTDNSELWTRPRFSV